MLLTKLQELKDSMEEEDTIQDLVSRAFEERGSLSNRTWEQIQSLLGPGVVRPGEQAEEQVGADYTQTEKDQALAKGEIEGAIPLTQSISRGGRVRKMSTKKAEQVESEGLKKGGKNLRKK
jgi:hypothetical protein